MLSLVESGGFHARADAAAENLALRMNDAIAARGVDGCVYGLASCLHISLGQDCPRPTDGIEWPGRNGHLPPRTPPPIALALKQGMLNHGVDLMGQAGALVSGVHSDADVDHTVDAFAATLAEMQAEGLL
jgi:glutamate-1-semialdehyde aminotransferase